MTFDSVVEVRYGELTYPGVALLALEIRASEQVNSVPEVAATVLGLRVRVWDGVSPASAPVLVRQYSANPAYAALELLTNATWGMGSIYRDEAVDLPGLVAWAQHCDETVTVPSELGGGTRPRLALSLWMADRRDGVEWLRVIGRAGRCEPSLAGRRWRFVVDRARAGIVERFGDGDIVMREGRPLLTWRRDLARNGALGASRANRLTARFANEQADGRADVQSFPEFGDGWLGPPESEAVREESLNLEGVSHPHQVAAELRLALRKIRTLTRTVVFTTSKAVVAVTPGEVFALSAGLVNWGFASGRVLPGSTSAVVVLDRDVTVAAGERRFVEIRHLDNTVEVAEIAVPTPTGELGGSGVVLPAGTAVPLVAALTQAPGYGAGYAIGRPGASLAGSPLVPASKPFVCQRVTPTIDDAGGLVWEIEGLEYDEAVYNESGQRWTRVRDYAAPLGAGVMPGAVSTLTAAANLLAGAGDDGAVDVAWTQTPADAAATAGFRVFYRVAGTAGAGNGGWVLLADQGGGGGGGGGLGRRGGLVRLGLASGTAVEFVVVAVGSDGRALAAEDERHPRASVVIGLPDDRPQAVTGLAVTALQNGRHRLTWTAPSGGPRPSGYRLDLWGQVDSPTPSTRELADCVPLAVVAEAEATFYVPWADGPQRRVWVRGMGPSGRMGPALSLVLPDPVAAPPGWTTESFELETDTTGTRDGLLVDAAIGNGGGLKLDTGETEGTWTSAVISLASGGPRRVRLDPQVLNLAADPAVEDFDLPLTGAAADQWGVVSGGGTSAAAIGMVGPPEPSSTWSVGTELRWREPGSGLWSPWVAAAAGGETDVVADALRVRVTLRGSADGVYRPGLGRSMFVAAFSENA
ncbi:MAG: hypothetical protein IOD15_01130 [Phycisphaerales bacterium]|nr:hypothetical protein [Phycisphaerales bacterium]